MDIEAPFDLGITECKHKQEKLFYCFSCKQSLCPKCLAMHSELSSREDAHRIADSVLFHDILKEQGIKIQMDMGYVDKLKSECRGVSQIIRGRIESKEESLRRLLNNHKEYENMLHTNNSLEHKILGIRRYYQITEVELQRMGAQDTYVRELVSDRQGLARASTLHKMLPSATRIAQNKIEGQLNRSKLFTKRSIFCAILSILLLLLIILLFVYKYKQEKSRDRRLQTELINLKQEKNNIRNRIIGLGIGIGGINNINDEQKTNFQLVDLIEERLKLLGFFNGGGRILLASVSLDGEFSIWDIDDPYSDFRESNPPKFSQEPMFSGLSRKNGGHLQNKQIGTNALYPQLNVLGGGEVLFMQILDNSLLAFGTRDNRIVIYDYKYMNMSKELIVSDWPIAFLQSPNDKNIYIISTYDSVLTIVNVGDEGENNNSRRSIKTKFPICSIGSSESKIVTLSIDNSLNIWREESSGTLSSIQDIKLPSEIKVTLKSKIFLWGEGIWVMGSNGVFFMENYLNPQGDYSHPNITFPKPIFIIIGGIQLPFCMTKVNEGFAIFDAFDSKLKIYDELRKIIIYQREIQTADIFTLTFYDPLHALIFGGRSKVFGIWHYLNNTLTEVPTSHADWIVDINTFIINPPTQ